jgi:dipeptidyl aminopeptidase/acylaminoacyl peptidase
MHATLPRASRFVATLSLAVVLVTGAGPARTEGETPILPRDVLFGNPERAMVRISPDGAALSWIAPVDGVLNVWVAPRGAPAQARAVTRDAKRGIRQYFWAYDSRHLVYLQDKDGDENWHVHAVDLVTGAARDLTPIDGVAARVAQVSEKFPHEILVGLNDRNPQLHDVWRVDVRTGEKTLLFENPKFAAVVTDDDYRVRFAGTVLPDGGTEYVRATESGDWEPYLTVSMADSMTTGLEGFGKDGNTVYMTDSRGRNTGALFEVNLATGEKKLIAEDDRADVGGVMAHPTEKHVQAVSINYARNEWRVIDPAIREDMERLAKVDPGDVQVTSRTLDDRWWLVAYLHDAGPVRYFLYDREAKTTQFLFTNRPAIEKLPLAPMHPVIVRSRDGLDLVCYLTLPTWRDPDGDGRPDAPLPMVLTVHGGPWARDSWGFDSTHQWLANRGYAVMSVNFRGSTGFGKEFVNAANGEWGKKMHDDLLDAVKWAVDQRVADAKKVAIVGGSYGGYAALVGLTFTPEVFAAGVSIVGPSSLVTLLESVPPYWKPALDMFTTRVGDHRTQDGRALLTDRSPLTHVDRIRRPLLIGQGANDPRVKKAESDQIVEAMKAKKILVTYVLFPDEGHGFARPPNTKAFNAVMEGFLGHVLGGRIEPIGDDFEGSSVQVPAGAEAVPGLPEALAAR